MQEHRIPILTSAPVPAPNQHHAHIQSEREYQNEERHRCNTGHAATKVVELLSDAKRSNGLGHIAIRNDHVRHGGKREWGVEERT